jgi:hypothetical protein
MASPRPRFSRPIGCVSLVLGAQLLFGAFLSLALAFFSGSEPKWSQDLRLFGTLALAVGGVGFGTFGLWQCMGWAAFRNLPMSRVEAEDESGKTQPRRDTH